MLPKTSMTSKTKTRQTSKQSISTKQIVAPFVHTKSTIPLNIHVEKKINIGQNSKSNEVHTWTALVAIALFVSSVLFPDKFSSNACCPKKESSPLKKSSLLPFLFFLPSLFTYLCIYHLPNPKSVPKGKSPIFSLLFSLSFF